MSPYSITSRITFACSWTRALVLTWDTLAASRPYLVAATILRVPAERLEMPRMLLEGGADPAVAGDDGRLPLHYAASDEHPCLMDMLLMNKPTTVNHVLYGGATPLYMASGYGNDKVVSPLLSAGARQPRPWCPNEIVRCPLEVAVSQLRFEVIRVLLDKGLDAIGGSSVLPNASGCCSTPRPRPEGRTSPGATSTAPR